MNRARRLLLCSVGIVGMLSNRAEGTPPDTHPLMPGIRSPEVWNANWPRTLHDKLATGFSPLVCNMQHAPREWGEVRIPGQLGSLQVLSLGSEQEGLLVGDDMLRSLSPRGEERWSRGGVGELVFHGELCGDDRSYLLMAAGRTLTLLAAKTGKTLWSHSFEPSYVSLRVRVADILVDRPGLEAAVFLNHGEEGALINFPPHGEPQVVWQKTVVVPGEYNERYDHHCEIELDLSQPDQPVIWNVRRYRARGFDARTGERLSTLEYEIGGEQRRNYGPWVLGRTTRGEPLAVVVSESVQLHAHAIRLRRSGSNELAWQHYYGEVYKDAPGVAIQMLGVTDLDGDGGSELIYTVRDPAQDFRSFVRIRDAETGAIEHELPDHWGAMLLAAATPHQSSGLLTFVAPSGATPTQGQLELYALKPTGSPERVAQFHNSKLVRPTRGESTAPPLEFFALADRTKNTARLECYTWNPESAQPQLQDTLTSPDVVAHNLLAIVRDDDGQNVFVLAQADGKLAFRRRDGALIRERLLAGAGSPTISAADLNSDGRAELLTVSPQGRLQVASFDDQGIAIPIKEHPYSARWFAQGPVVYNLLGDETPEFITIGAHDDGRFKVTARQLGRPPIWETVLDVYADEVENCVINAGQFLAADHPGVAISVTDSRKVHEGTFLLDGRTGEQQWYKSRYRDGATMMPYRPNGIPTAVDFDGDGVEEVGMDMLSYMAYLRGKDGSFAYIRHTPNIRTEEATYAGHLYNTFCPVYDNAAAARPHWLVTGGFGPFGLMKPDPREGIWKENLDYDVPPKIGMIDVDGDGRMEVGYAALRDATFVCRDMWTGQVEWELELPAPPNSPALSADVDGDGRGDFLIGGYCIGTDATGKGVLKWGAPHAIGWGLIADFDGDGRGEIACQVPGRVVVLRAADRAIEQPTSPP